MRKITALIGVSASGKSTFAAKEWAKDPLNTIIVSRDNIRQMFGYNDANVESYYRLGEFKSLEKEVTKYINSLIYDSLNDNKHVILDNTNLEYSRDLMNLKMWNTEVELKFFDVSLEEAILRDSNRIRKVGKKVIEKQFNSYTKLRDRLEKEPIDFTPVELNMDRGKKWAYIFDIDGTLANKCDRSPYDWHKVFGDFDNENVSSVARHLYSSFEDSKGVNKLFIVTGRDGVCLPDTEQWLSMHNIDYDGIYIRNKGDMRPDWLVKREFLQEIGKNHYIAAVFDDRMQVTRAMRMLGLTVFNVNHGNF